MSTIGNDLCTGNPIPRNCGKSFGRNLPEPEINPVRYDAETGGTGREKYPEGFDPVTGGIGWETRPEGYDPEIAGTGCGPEINPALSCPDKEPGRLAAFSTRVIRPGR